MLVPPLPVCERHSSGPPSSVPPDPSPKVPVAGEKDGVRRRLDACKRGDPLPDNQNADQPMWTPTALDCSHDSVLTLSVSVFPFSSVSPSLGGTARLNMNKLILNSPYFRAHCDYMLEL